MILALNTTLGPGELKGLQWRDVNWIDRTITIEPRNFAGDHNAKTEFRARVLKLGDEAIGVLRAMHAEALELFEKVAADSYVFFWIPARGTPDPFRPSKGWRSAWRSIIKAAGLPRGFRFYDLRHQAITELCENPEVPIQAIVRRAGWKDGRMLRKYEHIRDAAAARAAEALSGNSRYADLGREEKPLLEPPTLAEIPAANEGRKPS